MANCSEILDNRLNLTVGQNLLVFVLIIIIACLSVTINSILAVALWKAKQLINSTNIYIFMLSLSDCFQGAVALPLFAVVYLIYASQMKCKLFIIARGFSSFVVHISAYMILLIAFDRYVNIKLDFTKDNSCLRRLKSKYVSVLLLILGFTWSVLAAGSTVIENELAIKLPTICVFVVEMCAIITLYVLYIKMYNKVRRHIKTSVVYQGESNKERGGAMYDQEKTKYKRRNRPKYARELGKTILLIMIAVAVCYLPLIVTHSYITGFSQGTVSPYVQLAYHLSFPIAYCNSVINACIILHRNSRLRRYMKTKILGRPHQSFGKEDFQDRNSDTTCR